VKRWQAQFGKEATQALLEWNQSLPRIYLSAPEKPDYAAVSPWPGFFALPPGRFRDALADLESGRVYAQDPFTRIPVEMLHPEPGETILDLCAAPGGKSRLIAGHLAGRGRLLMVDRPGPRMDRLRQNAVLFCPLVGEIIASPLENLEVAARGHSLEKGGVDAVLIDVPCSNTGVMAKRPDVKLRLEADHITRLAAQQLAMLESAADWVRPGGRLVYSTCSLEREENDDVVTAFRERHSGWSLGERHLSLPWECGHDGGGAFLLTKQVCD
jgi:16S rRNA (cytosine967-C5)-methyltransferase